MFSRSPAEAFCRSGEGTSRDGIVVFEVTCEKLGEDCWRGRRKSLERALRQKAIVVRVQDTRLL